VFRLLIPFLVPSVLVCSAAAQVVAPAAVKRSAIAAVEDLGDKVVKGRHRVAIDRMFPKWKERMAKRKGGLEKLEQELEGIGAMMARNGVSLISFEAVGEPSVYEVDPRGGDGGVVFEKWLVLIPTVTTFRIMDPDSPKLHEIESHGFQVAIAGKEKLDWTFINGSDVTVADLRSMFVTLPVNMELPKVKRVTAK
jgi:hypothetical protein